MEGWAGLRHVCAIHDDDTLACWGQNTNGQVGDGTTQDRPTPTPVGMTNWQMVVTGSKHTCGLRNDGELYCWGDNSDGQIGDGSLFSTTPVLVP